MIAVSCPEKSHWVSLMEPAIVARQVRQSVPIYALYALLSIISFHTFDQYGQVESSTPIGLYIGPPIAVGNMIVAGSANKNFKAELMGTSLLHRTIADGETVYGLISIPENGYRPLSIKINQTAKINADSF